MINKKLTKKKISGLDGVVSETESDAFCELPAGSGHGPAVKKSDLLCLTELCRLRDQQRCSCNEGNPKSEEDGTTRREHQLKSSLMIHGERL